MGKIPAGSKLELCCIAAAMLGALQNECPDWRQDAAVTGTLEARCHFVEAAILAAGERGFQPRISHDLLFLTRRGQDGNHKAMLDKDSLALQ